MYSEHKNVCFTILYFKCFQKKKKNERELRCEYLDWSKQ